MKRRLLAMIPSMNVCPNRGLGGAFGLPAWQEIALLSDDNSIHEGIFTAIAGWLHPDQLISSGRCRAT